MRNLAVGLFIVFLVSGCGTGITLRGTEPPGTETGETGPAGGLPGTPTTPVVTTSGAGSGIVSTANLTLFIRTSATSFRGGVQGETMQITDPILESGIDRVLESVSRAE
jgi:hypothetical protein